MTAIGVPTRIAAVHDDPAAAAALLSERSADPGGRPPETDDGHAVETAEPDPQGRRGHRRRCHGSALPAVQVPADVASAALAFDAGRFAGRRRCRLFQHCSFNASQLAG